MVNIFLQYLLEGLDGYPQGLYKSYIVFLGKAPRTARRVKGPALRPKEARKKNYPDTLKAAHRVSFNTPATQPGETEMTIRHEFYVVGGKFPEGPFRTRKAAERELRDLQAQARTDDPDPNWGDDDFGLYIQHRQF